MRATRALVAAVLGLTVLAAGCAQIDGRDAERLFDQGGDEVVPQPSPDEVPQPAEANLTVHFVDVGQGDGIVVHLPDHTIVYDTGRWQGESETAVRGHLQAEGADPDALVVSHPDADHAGGCEVVLDAFAIGAIYHPGRAKDTRTWEDCQAAMQAEGAPIYTDADLDLGQQLSWSTHAQTRVLHVDADAEDANTGSLALSLRYGDVTLALTGDATCEAEQRILDRGLVDEITIAQIAHHGSSTSTCQRWLQATQPEAGIVSVGADNNYGHPHEEVLDRLADHDVDVYRTDDHGTIEVTTDGTTWDVRTASGADSLANEADEPDEDETANATVAIGPIRHDAPGNDNENLTQEWVEIVNEADQPVDLANWTLSDEAGHTYRFPDGFRLPSGGNVTVHTGQGEDTADQLYWGRSQAVWNNDGDQASLRDSEGLLVAEKTY